MDETKNFVAPEEDDDDLVFPIEDDDDGDDKGVTFSLDDDGEYIEEDVETVGDPDDDDSDDPDEDKGDEDDEGEDDTPEEDPKEDEPPAVDPKDATIAELRKKLADRDRLAKDMLKKMGVEAEDVEEGLMKLAAEADDTTLEEYKRNKEEADRRAAAEALLARTEFEKLMAADLAAVRASYPATKEFASIMDIPNFKEFARLRDLGLSAKQAFAAANPEYIAQGAASSAEKKGLAGTKSHLSSVVPKKSSGAQEIRISRSEMRRYREMFPNKTDKEIVALYRATE